MFLTRPTQTQPVLPSTPVQETAHKDAAMEWWFFQGWFKGESAELRHFMVAFFQQGEHSSSAEQLTGHTLLLSHLNPKTSDHCYRSQISPAVSDLLYHYREEIKVADFDNAMIDDLMDEIRTYGPPRPIVENATPVKSAANRLYVQWADTVIRQVGEQFFLHYESPDEQLPCRFVLSPRSSRIFHELDAGLDQTMAYASIPRMTLEGTVAGSPVLGEAWFDHQWGTYAWFAAEGRGRQVLGWDWFGINLDDGSDLLLLIHRDMQNQRILKQNAIYIPAEGPSRELSSFRADSFYSWKSPVTLSEYPLGWQIELPEIDASLAITPLADDQELALFGVMRSTWEGACNVRGTKQGRKVSGRARLELHGYGYIFDFRTYLDRWVARIDRHIEAFLPPEMDTKSLSSYVDSQCRYDLGAQTQMLNRPVWDMMARGGKRWRPVFGFLLLNALGKSHLPFERLLSVFAELSHLGSLIIDDIEDQSPLRRGEASIHLRYGTDLAINAGNTLYFLPLLLLENHPHLSIAQRERVYQVMIRQYVRTHFGQGMDIYWSKFVSGDNLQPWIDGSLSAKVLDMYADKTAALVIGMAKLACIIAEAEEKVQKACVNFARSFGVAFQIMDDVLNFSNSGKWTKVIGEDLSAGKLTYVFVKAMEKTEGSARETLQRLACDEGYRRDFHHIETGLRIIQESGALEECRREAHSMVQAQWHELSRHLVPSEPKLMLRLLCSKLTDLTFVA